MPVITACPRICSVPVFAQNNGNEIFSLLLKPLAQFDGDLVAAPQTGILFHLHDYLELVDWTGRIVRKGKRGSIPNHLPPILQRLEITPQDWLSNSQNFEKFFIEILNNERKTINRLILFRRKVISENQFIENAINRQHISCNYLSFAQTI